MCISYHPAYGKAQSISEESVAPADSNHQGGSSSAGGDVQMSSASSGTSARPDGIVENKNPNKKKGMVLPFEQHSLTFDNVVYSVDMPQVK